MRVAAIYDIHGNLPALEAVLQEVRLAEVGLIVVGGDVVPGPMPRETLACLLDLDIRFSLYKAIARLTRWQRWQAQAQSESRNSFERLCAGRHNNFFPNTNSY
jgi:hypothetical protein